MPSANSLVANGKGQAGLPCRQQEISKRARAKEEKKGRPNPLINEPLRLDWERAIKVDRKCQVHGQSIAMQSVAIPISPSSSHFLRVPS
jgi:hypothetical protein